MIITISSTLNIDFSNTQGQLPPQSVKRAGDIRTRSRSLVVLINAKNNESDKMKVDNFIFLYI